MKTESVVRGSGRVFIFIRLLGFAFGWLFMIGALSGTADTIFDNSRNDLGRRFDPRDIEVGDEIQVVGQARSITNFSFEYWGDSTSPGVFAGDVQARVRFYRNDGPSFHDYAAPGTLFYDSGWFNVVPTLRSSLIFLEGSDFPAGGLYLPVTNFTWTVQFQGFGAGDSAGVDLFSPISMGLGFPDYWENDPGSGWRLMTNNVAVMNFAAKMQACDAPYPPPPVLEIAHSAGQIILSWPSSATTFVLETSPLPLPGAPWTRDALAITSADGRFLVTVPATSPVQFYRLRQ